MLTGIPSILSPDLVKTLMEMGHGDEIVIADGHFPAASLARNLVRSDACKAPELVDAILKLFPLDSYVDHPVALMATVPGDSFTPAIWERYRGITTAHGHDKDFEYVERFTFYERARRAYAIVTTSETAQYANIIFKKGIVRE